MTRKQRRLYFTLTGLAALAVAAALVLSAFQDNLVFFYSPSDVAQKQIPAERRFRLGGLVEPGSVAKAGTTTAFAVTDNARTIKVVYTGLLPDLFREGQGVVTEGRLNGDGVFMAATVLAKHDENYMPPEVADALKRSGQWRHAEPAAAK
jgi:cytochrome c-type biogenesis protein CcmE